VKNPPTTPLVGRDSATRWARHLAVVLDVGELCFNYEGFVAETTFAKRTSPMGPLTRGGLGSQTHPSVYFLGIPRAMVGS